MAKTVDDAAPKFLTIEIKTSDGKVWGTIRADEKEFKTGSRGFYANGKVKNPDNGLAYQLGANIILVGSKG